LIDMGHRRSLLLLGAGAVAVMAGGACTAPPSAPEHPTWVDVAPILRGECNECHGSTAPTTGALYRFDFYEMNAATCGEAARALPAGTALLAGAAAPLIKTDITPMVDGHPRMPPLPAAPLLDWERDTLTRWGAQPAKGSPPPDNHAPTIELGQLPFTVDQQLAFTAVVSDPDGESVIGTIEIGGYAFLMNRSGSFAVSFDSSQWPPGSQRLTAYLCDGWTNVSYDLGPVQITH
jgi:hypothetical protein